MARPKFSLTLSNRDGSMRVFENHAGAEVEKKHEPIASVWLNVREDGTEWLNVKIEGEGVLEIDPAAEYLNIFENKEESAPAAKKATPRTATRRKVARKVAPPPETDPDLPSFED